MLIDQLRANGQRVVSGLRKQKEANKMDQDNKQFASGNECSLTAALKQCNWTISTRAAESATTPSRTTTERLTKASKSKHYSDNDSSQVRWSELIIMQTGRSQRNRSRRRRPNLCQSSEANCSTSTAGQCKFACHNSWTNQLTLMAFFLWLLVVLLVVQTAGKASAQCPWARDSSYLHSDCICDFNPQPNSNSQPSQPQQQQLQQQQQQSTSGSTASGDTSQPLPPVVTTRRMSVQCAPVDFEQLLRALKQTASIELPWQLAKRTFATDRAVNASGGADSGDNNDALHRGLPDPSLGQSEALDDSEQVLEETRIRFISQAKLDLLHVSNSTIGKLDDNTFILDTRRRLEGMTSTHLVVAIQALHLSRCGIYHIAPGAFNGLEWSLTSLSLNDNQLESIATDAINKLANLRLLDLSSNRIKFIGAGAFLKLNKLNTLRLADNRQIGQYGSSSSRSRLGPALEQQQGIDMNAFEGLEASLNDLNLKNNQLGEFPRAIGQLKSLAFLNLAQNHIARVPRLIFKQMATLTAINLERNRIVSIDNETFAGVEQTLSSLSLLGNLIESVPVEQLAQLRALRRLDLGFNQIDLLPVNSFANSTKLILVALDGNPLETLPELAFKPLEGTLRGLSVGGKSLNCDCRLSWMLRWQLEHGLQISSRERTPQFCAKPNYLRSLVSFAALKPEHLTCGESSSSSSLLDGSITAPAPAKARVSQFGSVESNGGWSASGANELTYFTLSDSQPPTSTTATSTTSAATSTAPSTASSPITATTKADAREPSSASLSQANPSTTAAPEVASIDLPKEQKSPNSVEELAEPNKRLLDESSPSTSASTYATPTIALVTVTSADNDEMTDSSYTIATTSTTSSSTSQRDDSGIGELNGEPKSVVDTSMQNKMLSLGELPDDELFVSAPHETAYASRHKLSRHGYLASTPNDLMRYNKTTGSGSISSKRTTTASISTTSTGINQHQNSKQQHDMQKHRSDGSTTRQATSTNHNAPIPQRHLLKQVQQTGAAVNTIQSVFGERQQQQQQQTQFASTASISSASQAAGDELPARRESGRPTAASMATSATVGQRFNHQAASQQQHQQVPAVPTLINVYKMPQATGQISDFQSATSSLPFGLNIEQQQHHQSQRLNKWQQRQLEATSLVGSLLSPSKGARFVDDTTGPTQLAPSSSTIPPTTMTSAAPAAASQITFSRRGQKVRPTTTTPQPPPTTTTTTNAPEIAEMDIERYSQPAASVVQSQFTPYVRHQPPPVSLPTIGPTYSPSSSSAVEPTSTPSRAPKTAAATTTTTSTPTIPPALLAGTPMEMYTNQPQYAYVQPQFNTRQSVSSMYRLASASSTKPTVSATQNRYTSAPAQPTATITAATASAVVETKSTASPSLSPSRITATMTTTSTTPTIGPPIVSRAIPDRTAAATTTNSDRMRSQEPISADSSLATATTRMAATIRIVDSLPQVRIVSQGISTRPTTSTSTTTTTTTSTTTSTTSTTSTTTPAPETTTASPALPIDGTPTQMIMPTTTTTTAKKNRMDVVELVDFGLASSQAPASTVSGGSASGSNNNLIGQSQHQDSIGRQFSEESAHNSAGTLSTSTTFEETSRSQHTGHHHNDNHRQQPHHYSTSQSVPPVTTTITMTTPAPTPPPTTIVHHQHLDQLPPESKETAHRDQQSQQPSLSNQFFDSGSKLLVKRFPKLADFDQVALVLAGVLCVFTFLIALIAIICTCCCSSKRGLKPALTRLDSSQASCSPTTNLSSSPITTSGRHHNHHQRTSNECRKASRNNCLMRFFSCCFGCKSRTASSLTTPIESLIMHDDENSTSSSSADASSSSSRQLNGKSMLLASVQLGQQSKGQQNGQGIGRGRRHCLRSNTLNQRKSLTQSARLGPLNLEASMRIHRQAHAIEKGAASGGYFMGMMSAGTGHMLSDSGRTIGRRKSRWASEIDLDARAMAGDRRACDRRSKLAKKLTVGGGWISDSCDSDKSCSPGANRNNRYNISDAHRAYLAGKQIQASMFVTTQSGGPDDLICPSAGAMMQSSLIGGCAEAPNKGQGQRIGCNGGRRWGLLKTIDNVKNSASSSGANAHHQAHNQAVATTDYFGNCNLSDRSTTDDSRAPLDRLSPQQLDIMPAPPPHSGNDATRYQINRSISMSSKFPIVGRALGAATTSFGQAMVHSNNEHQRDNNNDNYNHQQHRHQQQQHHYNQQQSSSNNNQRVYELSSGDLLPISAEEEWPEPYVEPAPTSNNKDMFAGQPNCNDSDNNNNNNTFSRHLYGMNEENFAPSSTITRHPHQHRRHDHQFNSVDNHHCSQDRQLDVNYIQQAQVMSSHMLTNRSYDEAYLANWRTIGREPTNSTAESNDRTTTIGAGGANWLRWTPAEGGT